MVMEAMEKTANMVSNSCQQIHHSRHICFKTIIRLTLRRQVLMDDQLYPDKNLDWRAKMEVMEAMGAMQGGKIHCLPACDTKFRFATILTKSCKDLVTVAVVATL